MKLTILLLNEFLMNVNYLHMPYPPSSLQNFTLNNNKNKWSVGDLVLKFWEIKTLYFATLI